MKLISKRLYERVFDPLAIHLELDVIYNDFKEDGNKVDRRAFGIVVLTLDDGEIHFTPGPLGIYEHIFSYDQEGKEKGGKKTR